MENENKKSNKVKNDIIDLKKIKKLLIDKEMKTDDLAGVLNISYSGVNQKLGGFKRFTIKDTRNICTKLKVKVKEIMLDELIQDLQI